MLANAKIQQMLAAANAQKSAQQTAAPVKVELKNWKGKYYQTTQFLGVPLPQFLLTEFTRVPTFIWNATNFIETYALQQEGIYRLAPAMDKFNQVLKALDEHPDMPFPPDTNPNIVAQLIKRFLRELPDPPIPVNLADEFIAAGSLEDEEAQGKAIMTALSRMPLANRDLLCVLFKHLCLVAANEATNRMGCTNLSTVFNPCLFRSKDSMPLILAGKQQAVVFAWLINHIDEVIAEYPLPSPSAFVSFAGPSSYAQQPGEVIKNGLDSTFKNREYATLLFPVPPFTTPHPRARSS